MPGDWRQGLQLHHMNELLSDVLSIKINQTSLANWYFFVPTTQDRCLLFFGVLFWVYPTMDCLFNCVLFASWKFRFLTSQWPCTWHVKEVIKTTLLELFTSLSLLLFAINLLFIIKLIILINYSLIINFN